MIRSLPPGSAVATSAISATNSVADDLPVREVACSEIWICFTPPPVDPPRNVLIVSFMPPSTESLMEQRYGAQVVSGRLLIQEVRAQARMEYLKLIARIGSTPCGGRTLRQELQGPGNYSRWWFLWVTEKDCVWDQDTIYTTILRLKAVQAAKERYQTERVVLYGADPGFAAAFGRGEPARRWIAGLARAVVGGVLSRLRLISEYVGLWWTLRHLPVPPPERRDVLLQAYWDWSVRPAGGRLHDRYFAELPAQLGGRGMTVGWLASCDLYAEPWQHGRTTGDVVAAASAHNDVTLLERFLVPTDIVREALNLSYPIRLTRFVFDRRFQRLCALGPFGLHPLVRTLLLRAAWGATVARLQLIATATARACRRIEPRMILTFMELLMRARAIYAGASASSTRVAVWAAQHAGYSSDKTLGVFDPEIEMRGTPDGCAMPAPDGMFVMGDLSRRIWQASGLSPTRVIATGGLRYQSVQIRPPRQVAPKESVSILLAGGMNEAAELELCDAGVAAVADLPSVKLSWRDHPSYQFSQRGAFRVFRNAIAVTSRTLDEDFESADLVLFTHTGIAEEALLRGIPTWQWLWSGFNTSPFLDVPVIPTFTSVRALRRELQAFVRDPARYQPTIEAQRRVLRECFGLDPAGASIRVADAVREMIAPGTGVHR